jgi:hypothetical protein
METYGRKNCIYYGINYIPVILLILPHVNSEIIEDIGFTTLLLRTIIMEPIVLM